MMLGVMGTLYPSFSVFGNISSYIDIYIDFFELKARAQRKTSRYST